jgi:hypothetical protein
MREGQCPYCERRVLVHEEPARCPLCDCPLDDDRMRPFVWPGGGASSGSSGTSAGPSGPGGPSQEPEKGS